MIFSDDLLAVAKRIF
jgi:hypothetical protein